MKVTVTIDDRSIIFLDKFATTVREKSNSIIDRSSIIRAFICAVEDSNINLNSITSAEEIRGILTAKLKSKN